MDCCVGERLRTRVAKAITEFHRGDWEAIVGFSDKADGLKIQLEAADELIGIFNRHGVEISLANQPKEIKP